MPARPACSNIAPDWTLADMGWSARSTCCKTLLPAHEQTSYAEISTRLLEEIDRHSCHTAPRSLRLHGDCHHGNILWTDEGTALSISTTAATVPRCRTCGCCCTVTAASTIINSAQCSRLPRCFRFRSPQLALIEPRGSAHAALQRLARQALVDPAFSRLPDRAAPLLVQHVADLRHQCEELREPPLVLY